MLCFGIEFSQLLSYEWLMQLRSTRMGALVLGQGFLWSDIVAYTAGVLLFGIVLSHLEHRASKKNIVQ